MAELPNGVNAPARTPDASGDPAVSLVELHNRLNRAYLSGDGAAVEHVMEQITARQRSSALAATA